MAEFDGEGIVKEDSRAASKDVGLNTYTALEAEQRVVAERIRSLEVRKRLAEMEKREQEMKEEIAWLTVGQSRSREGSRRKQYIA